MRAPKQNGVFIHHLRYYVYFCGIIDTFFDMKPSLSILIPTYNDECYKLVSALYEQAERLRKSGTFEYEIIVADDGSTSDFVISENKRIRELPHCQYILREENIGRAAIRNYLMSLSKHEWLLFIDSDMLVETDSFLENYVCEDGDCVFYGGYKVRKNDSEQAWNLRYLYETANEKRHLSTMRTRKPYRDFHTSNFMVARHVMKANPLDTRFRYYGYEDVFFGKRLAELHIPIKHLDNPLLFSVFESNTAFVKKTEEGLRTLFLFREELRGYSTLLALYERMESLHLIRAMRFFHHVFGRLERFILCGRFPNLFFFRLYKLGYFTMLFL